MTGKDMIDYITKNHLENAEVMVFSSEKWMWVPADTMFHHGPEKVSIDAKYLSEQHLQALKGAHKYDCPSL